MQNTVMQDTLRTQADQLFDFRGQIAGQLQSIAQSIARLEAISGAEEARLVYWAARSRIPMEDEPWLMTDLGGGSLEVAIVDGNEIRTVESLGIGTVRLLEEFESETGGPKRIRRLLDEYVSGLRFGSYDEDLDVEGHIATGGNIDDLARVAGDAGVNGGRNEVSAGRDFRTPQCQLALLFSNVDIAVYFFEGRLVDDGPHVKVFGARRISDGEPPRPLDDFLYERIVHFFIHDQPAARRALLSLEAES